MKESDIDYHYNRSKLIDLGWAWPVHDNGPQDYRGTLGYIPPEQIRDPCIANKTADVFSMGAVLYEMLTGQPVFGGTEQDKRDASLSLDFLHPQDIAPWISEQTTNMILTCLAERTEDRSADATELLYKLSICLNCLSGYGEKDSNPASLA